ncbi:hypothetical protein, partial [Streptomyces sp. IBSBF 2390]|uniref:hypothetical protein n=1 Tax=Streptomyces sp. IBSBF 2390 TaxID=2903533 RepID=UPI002FDBD2D5
ILDKKPLWTPHIKSKISKASSCFWQCRKVFGKTWGLSPEKVMWIYKAIIRTIIFYAAIIWWMKLSCQFVMVLFNKLQRTVCLGCTGCFSSTPLLFSVLGFRGYCERYRFDGSSVN